MFNLIEIAGGFRLMLKLNDTCRVSKSTWLMAGLRCLSQLSTYNIEKETYYVRRIIGKSKQFRREDGPTIGLAHATN